VSWDHSRSVERIRDHLNSMGEIAVEKLKKEADLEKLLSETTCRDIFGSHVYVPVSNFARLASCATDKDEITRLIQSVHIYQREVSRIVENTFDGLRVHFQGSRLHTLFYRPIDNAKDLSVRSVLLQFVLQDFVSYAFNPVFSARADYVICGGSDIGEVVGTQDGVKGDRELLFVGGAANHAAHVIGPSGKFRLSESVFDELPKEIQSFCVRLPETSPAEYQLTIIDRTQLDELCRANGISWDRDESKRRIEAECKQFPLADIAYSGASALIDLESLSIKNNKRVLAASIFADLSGFTAYIDSAESNDKKVAALRVMHAVRKEFARVLTSDFEGLRIQYQGDNVQAIFHLPDDDEVAIAKKAVKAAAGLQSSMETSLKECLPEASELHLAVGIDVGTTVISKLGTHGARDRICLGEPVETASGIQQSISGRETGISSRVYDALPEELQAIFTKYKDQNFYVSKDLTTERLERVEEGKMYDGNAPVYLKRTLTGIAVSEGEAGGGRPVKPSRTYSD
jgi:class 3 adenylate cyclase